MNAVDTSWKVEDWRPHLRQVIIVASWDLAYTCIPMYMTDVINSSLCMLKMTPIHADEMDRAIPTRILRRVTILKIAGFAGNSDRQ